MISLLIVFYLFVGTFALIGSMRGWAKEVLVIFSVILALAFITVVEELIPVIGPFLKSNPSMQYWVRMGIVFAMTFFGYQSPKFSRLEKAAEKRDKIQDALLGLVIGALSGYFVVGTIWYFTHSASYPVISEFVVNPPANLEEATQRILNILPPTWLGKQPQVYIAVVLSFIFVIVLFI